MQKKRSDFLPKDIKGQEMSVTTIILIVLGLVVLVILILGFRIGWSKVLPFLPSNNVENVVASCNAACATGNKYDFCTFERTLKAEGLPGGEKEAKSTCNVFATDTKNYINYGIEPCPGLCPTTPPTP